MKRSLAAIQSPPLARFAAAGREALALARHATLMPLDLMEQELPVMAAGEHVAVLVHGLFATAGVLRPMREAIERDTGAHTASFTYRPGPGVASVAESVAELVDRLPADVHVHLIGHSMGGLAVRWYVQELGGDPRIVQTVSLASPFNGTRRAWLMPSAAGRDIAPGSDVLRRLSERGECGVPHLSVVAEADTLVTEDASLHHGERIVIAACGHNGLIYHGEVLRLVVERLLARMGPRAV
jgi:pimeloyl-ACP methyl ester carboxylesterase